MTLPHQLSLEESLRNGYRGGKWYSKDNNYWFVLNPHGPVLQLEMNEGYIKVTGGINNNTATSIEGIFAAGDVASPNYQQAVIASASGAMAAMDVRKAINN